MLAKNHHPNDDLTNPPPTLHRYLDAGLMNRISGGSGMSTVELFGDFEQQYDGFVNATGRSLPFGLQPPSLCSPLDPPGFSRA
jgi:hypothetical protein